MSGKLSFGVVFVVCTLGTIAVGAPQYFEETGHFYDVIVQDGITWEQAASATATSSYLGITGHLATFTQAEENDFAASLLPFAPGGTEPPWYCIGGVQSPEGEEPAGGWGWITGEAWGYTNWKPGEPNNHRGAQENLLMDGEPVSLGMWLDHEADRPEAKGYIVEYEPAPMPAPIAEWRLDEGEGATAHDTSGYGRDGTVNGATWVEGVSGAALSFESGQYVDLGTGLLGGDQFTDITIDAWFNCRSDSPIVNPYSAIFADETTDGEINVGVAADGRAMALIYTEGASGTLYGPHVADDQWHRITVTKSGDQAALIVDGLVRDTMAVSGSLRVNQETHVTIGEKWTTFHGASFPGMIDEVRVYDQGLPLPGDANMDGAITDADYTIWADHYGASPAIWLMGDFDGSGEITDADYTIWADNYGAGTSAIPEPATLSILALSVVIARRRR
jgi:Concanavalin A-like lectin/glucanases superfamily